MPGTVTVPDVLEGHAADIWRAAFLSAYDGTCAKRGDQRDSCAAAVAWAAVKNKYRKDSQGKWVERATETEVGMTNEIEGPVFKSVHPNDMGDLSLPLVIRKDYSPEKHAEMAKKGWALPDGSYPIADKGDLRDAIQSFGRASASKQAQVKAHITKRAKALGAEDVSSEWGGKSDEPKAEEKSVTLTSRAVLSAKAAAEDAALLASPEADLIARRPDHISSGDWVSRPPVLRTVRALVIERSVERSYEDAVERTTAEGWQPISNPTRAGEYVFQRWLDTPDGALLQRSILVRRATTLDWRLRELTRGASLSLAVQVPADERRYGDTRPFELLTPRGGPGSGHFGHEGRPGERGGSAPGEGGPADEKPQGGGSRGSGAPSSQPHKGGLGQTGGSGYSGRVGGGEKKYRDDIAYLAKNYSTVQMRKMQEAAQEALKEIGAGGGSEGRASEAQYALEVLGQAVGVKEFGDWEVSYPSWMKEMDAQDKSPEGASVSEQPPAYAGDSGHHLDEYGVSIANDVETALADYTALKGGRAEVLSDGSMSWVKWYRDESDKQGTEISPKMSAGAVAAYISGNVWEANRIANTGEKEPVGQWSSRGGKWGVELYRQQMPEGVRYGYTETKGGGSSGFGGLQATTEADAIAEMQKLVDEGRFQADANKSPMKFSPVRTPTQRFVITKSDARQLLQRMTGKVVA